MDEFYQALNKLTGVLKFFPKDEKEKYFQTHSTKPASSHSYQNQIRIVNEKKISETEEDGS
jgi:hypothetical protein